MRIEFRNIKCSFQSFMPPYTKDLFRDLQNHLWEPDTVNFLENNLDKSTLFVDIGASIGIFSIIGASLGAQVIAYEPMSLECRNFISNMESNSSRIISRITLHQFALGNDNLKFKNVKWKDFRRTDIISAINFRQAGSDREIQNLAIRSFSEEVLDCIVQAGSKKLVFKIDIEGAEYAILQNNRNIKALKLAKAKCLIAFHPGAFRPHTVRVPIIARMLFEIFKFRNRLDAKRIFKSVTIGGGVINKMNNTKVVLAKDFARLIDCGTLEFIFDF